MKSTSSDAHWALMPRRLSAEHLALSPGLTSAVCVVLSGGLPDYRCRLAWLALSVSCRQAACPTTAVARPD